MLKQLTIRNYAIIENLEIEFDKGLNIITGETGAGKSILLGALGLLSGAKVESGVVGESSKPCLVEGVFTTQGYGLEEFFEANDLDFATEITIRRVINGGKSRAYIDEQPINISLLKELSDKLIDIHSQHQSLLLSHVDFQTRILDAVSLSLTEVELYRQQYKELKNRQNELARLQERSAETSKRRDYLQYQLDELLEANLESGQSETMEAELHALTHAEEIAQGLNFATQALDNDESGILSSLKTTIGQLQHIKEHIAPVQELCVRLNTCYLELKDISCEAASLLENVAINPTRAQWIEERLGTIYSLCRKHNLKNDTELLNFARQIDSELLELSDSDEHIEKLKAHINELESSATKLAAVIDCRRRETAPTIEHHTQNTLAELGIKNAVFRIEISDTERLTPTGKNGIRFLFSANEGMAPQNIEQVASGGEISRLMLSLKGLVSKSVQLPTIIFDEIDTGVSGSVADCMGRIIWNMSSTMQVINITHLPQVASKGNHHFFVYKNKGTHIKKLTPQERLEHIASMLSGSEVTDAARAQAAALLSDKE
ncbi:MAG: DNA repair protein RecN [Mucinivorans sp.]